MLDEDPLTAKQSAQVNLRRRIRVRQKCDLAIDFYGCAAARVNSQHPKNGAVDG